MIPPRWWAICGVVAVAVAVVSFGVLTFISPSSDRELDSLIEGLESPGDVREVVCVADRTLELSVANTFTDEYQQLLLQRSTEVLRDVGALAAEPTERATIDQVVEALDGVADRVARDETTVARELDDDVSRDRLAEFQC